MSAEDTFDTELEQRLRDHFAQEYGEVRGPDNLWEAITPGLSPQATLSTSRNGASPESAADSTAWLPQPQTSKLPTQARLAPRRARNGLAMVASLVLALGALLAGGVGLSYMLNRQQAHTGGQPTVTVMPKMQANTTSILQPTPPEGTAVTQDASAKGQVVLAVKPSDWDLTGDNSRYESGVDPQVMYNGQPSVYMKAQTSSVPNSGASLVMKHWTNGELSGKRIRLSAYIRAQSVTGSAGLFLVGAADQTMLPMLDSSLNQPVSGTTDWQKREVVIVMPAGAASMSLGLYMPGTGEVWIADTTVEVVGSDVPLTVMQNIYNGGFEQGFTGYQSNSNSTNYSGGYQTDIDSQTHHGGTASMHVTSTTSNPPALTTYFQDLAAAPFAGIRLRFSGYIKTADVKGGAVLYLRIEETNGSAIGKQFAFDNGPSEQVTGTTDWTRYDMVADVPADIPANSHIIFGFAVHGTGEVWFDDFQIEQVGTDVNTTAREQLTQTTNLGFEDGLSGWWWVHTQQQGACSSGLDRATAHSGSTSAHVECSTVLPGVLTVAEANQDVDASSYAGKRVRVSAYIKTQNVEDSANLVIAVIGPNLSWPANVDTSGDPPKGTAGWKKYDLVIDIPSDVTDVVYGINLVGKGQAWMDDVQVEVVGNDVPVTTPVPTPAPTVTVP